MGNLANYFSFCGGDREKQHVEPQPGSPARDRDRTFSQSTVVQNFPAAGENLQAEQEEASPAEAEGQRLLRAASPVGPFSSSSEQTT